MCAANEGRGRSPQRRPKRSFPIIPDPCWFLENVQSAFNSLGDTRGTRVSFFSFIGALPFPSDHSRGARFFPSYKRTCTFASATDSGIGEVNLPHLLHRASVVRVVLHRECSIRALDLLQGRIQIHTEDSTRTVGRSQADTVLSSLRM
jgi:hypothetical protein